MTMMNRISKLLMRPLQLLENKYIAGGVKIFLILYAAMVAPKLPMFMAKALKNPVVKLLILFLIVYTGVKDPMMSLLVAVGFTVSMLTLNKLETVGNLNEIIDGAIDIPQSLLNDVVDGAQDLTLGAAGLIGSPVKEVVGVVNDVVDAVQGLTNTIIDGAQEIVTGAKDVVLKQENFSMEDRTLNVTVPDMGTLDGLSGYDGGMIGAPIDMSDPLALQ